MELSPLQMARYQYNPKLPGMLRNGISDICVRDGEATESVADQEKIKALFPNTYGKNEITFQKGKNTSAARKHSHGKLFLGLQLGSAGTPPYWPSILPPTIPASRSSAAPRPLTAT